MGHHENYWGPTLDDNSDGVHPAEPAVRTGKEREESDQRRVIASMVAKSKKSVNDIIRSVKSVDRAMARQDQVQAYVTTLLLLEKDKPGPGNPARPPQKGRPKANGSRTKPLGPLQGKKRGDNNMEAGNRKAGNPPGVVGSSRRAKRMRDSHGAGSGRKPKSSKQNSISSDTVA